jgi:Flp pilus assembly protein TadG
MDESTVAVPTITRPWTRIAEAIRSRGREAGQALVEFAMIVPLLVLLLCTLVDFGRAFYTWLLVTNAAREGARVAATQQPVTNVVTRINDSISGLDSTELTITLTNVQGPRGEPVEVDLAYDFAFVSPIGDIINFVSGGSLTDPTITSHASMRLE